MFDNFLAVGNKFPPDSEKERLNEYAKNLDLFNGNHDKVFLEAFTALAVKDGELVEFIFNWYKRLSVLFADLLFTEPPYIKSADEKQNDFLTNLVKTNKFVDTSYKVTIDLHRYGTGLYKAYIEDGKVKIQCFAPSIWFPLYDSSNINRLIEHIIAYTDKQVPEQSNFNLFAEEHLKGKIIYHTFQVKDNKLFREIETREESTGIDDFLIVDVENIPTSDNPIGRDDYQDLDTIILELERRFIQRGRILDKHADPNMTGPKMPIKSDPMTGEVIVEIGGGRYFARNPGDVPVEYVTWEGQLAAVNQEIQDLMEQLYAISETCPALFGQLKQGLAESGSALKRLLISPLLKSTRFRNYMDEGMKKILSIASKLAVANGIENAVEVNVDDISIDWQDGLPNDMTEAISNEATAVSAGLTSKESAITRLYGLTGDALQNELTKIINENKALQQATQIPTPEIKLPEVIPNA